MGNVHRGPADVSTSPLERTESPRPQGWDLRESGSRPNRCQSPLRQSRAWHPSPQRQQTHLPSTASSWGGSLAVCHSAGPLTHGLGAQGPKTEMPLQGKQRENSKICTAPWFQGTGEGQLSPSWKLEVITRQPAVPALLASASMTQSLAFVPPS